MTRPRFLTEGARRARTQFRDLLLAALALSGALACGPGSGGASATIGHADAAVTFQSAVTTPATWNSLWGSWPGVGYDHAMAYDSI